VDFCPPFEKGCLMKDKKQNFQPGDSVLVDRRGLPLGMIGTSTLGTVINKSEQNQVEVYVIHFPTGKDHRVFGCYIKPA